MPNSQLEKYRRIAKKLKNPAPVELPSGKFRCQVTVSGRRESVINEDPRVAHAEALAIKAKLLEANNAPRDMTVGDAIDRYIESKTAILSPSTTYNYRKIRKNDLQNLMRLRLSDVTQELVQISVNNMSRTHSPKSVRNAHGLLSAALAEYAPKIVLRTKLPQKEKTEISIPSEDEISKIMSVVQGTQVELPVMLAIWLGFRASEICGLTWDCIDGNILHIRQAIVYTDEGAVKKGSKTYSGNRKIRIPDHILKLIEEQPRINERIVQLSGQAIYKRFSRLCEKNGIRHFRFHDLRHANASVMLALRIPDKYAMERMGHATNNMLKTVYQHTMKEEQERVADIVDDYFFSKLHMDLHTKE